MKFRRNEKKIGKSLEAKVILGADGELYDFLKAVEAELPEIFITSAVEVVNEAQGFAGEVEGLSVSVAKADGEKCERCWKFSTTVGKDANHAELCAHCAAVIAKMEE